MHRFHTLRLKGNIQGQKVTVVFDGGSNHNFIDTTLVERRNIPTKNFDGFTAIIPGNNYMDYAKWIPKLQVSTIGNYIVTDNFYVVNFDDTNVDSGVQLLYSIWEHTMNYQVP